MVDINKLVDGYSSSQKLDFNILLNLIQEQIHNGGGPRGSIGTALPTTKFFEQYRRRRFTGEVALS